MSSQNPLYALSELLGRVPSLFYGIIYLAAIPIFALYYCSLKPHPFYHSTAQHETYLLEDGLAARAGLEAAVRENIIRVEGASVITNGEWWCDTKDIHCTDLQTDQRRFTLSVWAWCNSTSMVAPADIELTFNLSHSLSSNTNDGPQMFWVSEKNVGQQKAKIGFARLFPLNGYLCPGRSFVSAQNGRESGFIVISPQLKGQLLAYAEGMRGFPSYSSGSFERMFYLSAVTIATVGYGDIVPITPAARAAVSFEAILGIVLIGLFLNALANEFKNRRSEERTL